MSDNDNGSGGFFGGFLLGAIVGGAVAVFLTQEETRDLLVGKAREAGNMATDGAADLYERGRAVVENARQELDRRNES
jgi:gas vesicle protein